MLEFAVCAAWHNWEQAKAFLEAWNVPGSAHPDGPKLPEWLFFEQDVAKEGGAKTKNRAVRKAVAAGAQMIVVLDDDCFPGECLSLPAFAKRHAKALEPQSVNMFKAVTSPPSRGTPYHERCLTMPVAASMGFWTQNADHCAVRQLAFQNSPMEFKREPIYGKYFPLCGMNFAFYPAYWDPWFYHVEGVGRFDDIWMGWMWQREAYKRGYCFNLTGPLVRHSRQSNVWRNLADEARHLERNETLWRDIATFPYTTYDELRAILPGS